MKTLSAFFFSCVVCLFAACSATAQAGTLDQAFDPPAPNPGYLQGNIIASLSGTFVDQAQTFTVGMAGSLNQLQVLIIRSGSIQQFTSDLLVDIRPTIGGVPVQDDSSAFASAVVPVSTVASFPFQWVTVDFSNGTVSVLPGQQLAIVLRIRGTLPINQEYGWRGDSGDQYPGGSAYYRSTGGNGDGVWNTLEAVVPGFDYGFRTYVTEVPEPTALGLLIAGTLTALLCCGYRGVRECRGVGSGFSH